VQTAIYLGIKERKKREEDARPCNEPRIPECRHALSQTAPTIVPTMPRNYHALMY